MRKVFFGIRSFSKHCAAVIVIAAASASASDWTSGTGKVTTDGVVGIGTSSPVSGADLHVYRSSGNTLVKIDGAQGILQLNTQAASKVWAIAAKDDGSLVIDDNNTTSPVVIQTGVPNNALYIKNTGNVGLGTNAPGGRLDVNGYGIVRNRLSVEGNESGQEAMVVNQKTSGDIAHFRQNGTVKVVFDGSGNVGIGTSSPSEKLHVSGNVKVTGAVIIGPNGWSMQAPDYVFEKGYGLESLAEVERYIDRNGHLPEIPSAKEMHEKGINLAEMNLRLLKKVEELTLHAIVQEKRIQKLEGSLKGKAGRNE